MHCSINLPTDPWSLADFENAQQLESFYTRYGCDGVEIILCGEDFADKIKPGMVRGLHLIYYPEWIALWREDYAYLDAEFGSRAAWQAFYNAKGPDDLVAVYRHELETARRLGAQYVVYHIADNPLPEYYTLRAGRSGKEVIDASCELLNTVFKGGDYSFSLLLENLMFSGMDLTDPRLTERALAGMDYPRTGVMLDTGHLMATDKSLRDEEAACRYICKVVDAHGGLAKHFEGMHLHKSLSGEHMLKASRGPAPIDPQDSYLDRFARTMRHMRLSDPHRPFETPAARKLVEHVSPRFLVHELSRADKAGWEKALAAQAGALGALR